MNKKKAKGNCIIHIFGKGHFIKMSNHYFIEENEIYRCLSCPLVIDKLTFNKIKGKGNTSSPSSKSY